MQKIIGRIHVLTDAVLQTRFSHQELARLALEGGADVIQFRQKIGSTRELIQTARELNAICRGHDARFIVNDRIDVAIGSEAPGVHLGQSDFPMDLARELLGEDKIIGGSASDMEEARICVEHGVDYIGLGPVYPTTSKGDAGPVGGLELLKRVAEAVSPVPVIAIGGIGEDNAGAVMDAGAHGIAVISSVCCMEDPRGAAARLRDVVDRHVGVRRA